jgi:serine/threonine protein kinase
VSSFLVPRSCPRDAFAHVQPENIMLDSTGYLRVIDFGFAKKVR